VANVELLKRERAPDAEGFDDGFLARPQADQRAGTRRRRQTLEGVALGEGAHSVGESIVGFGAIRTLDVDSDWSG
jgi:hypothetical protein